MPQFVSRVKADEEARCKYMIESLAIQDSKREGRKEGIEIGRTEGEHKKAVEDARNFLAEGITPEIVAKCTGLPMEEVQKLAEETAKV